MADPTPAPTLDKGPYSSTETKTIKIAGPVEFSITTKYESSHVPPTPSWKAPESDSSLIDALRPLVEMIFAKLEEIRQAQNPQ